MNDMRLKDYIISANTGLDAIKRAPIIEENTGLKCIRIQDISQKKKYLDWGNTRTTKKDYQKFKLRKNDLLIARTGATVGVSYLVKEECESVFNNGTIRLRFNREIDTNFVYQIFQTKSFKKYVDNISCVSTQPNLKVENLLRFTIPDINLKKQKRIAMILSKYDDLIENNNRCIELLEQIIEKIYIEWFVKFKFPENENYEFVECKPSGWIYGNDNQSNIPKKWHYGPLSEIGQFERGKNITSEKMIEGNIPVISAGLQPSGYHNEANVFGKSLTMSASGANAGYLKYNLKDIWAADCSYYQNDSNIWFVYSSLKFIKLAIKNLQVGAAQPHVYPKNINNLNIIIPEEKYIKMYQDKVSVMFEEIKILNEENTNLIQQRDLLLHRLMSGKLEIK